MTSLVPPVPTARHGESVVQVVADLGERAFHRRVHGRPASTARA